MPAAPPPPLSARTHGVALVVALALLGSAAHGQTGAAPPGIPCVTVDIAGDRTGHLDCATRRLNEAARRAQNQARAGIDLPVTRAGSPDVQTGVAHQGAARLRMGNALGRSVTPERPVAPRFGSHP